MSVDLSIIIPVINEAGQIRRTIERITDQHFKKSLQIIIVDGDPKASTIAAVMDRIDVVCITSKPGRGHQMNTGANAASGRVLCFLHCDTILPPGALDMIVELMADTSVDVGAFDLSIGAQGIGYRMIEKTASLRSRLTRIPYGDQAIFLRKAYFLKIGGFAAIPIMEDVDLMQRIRRHHGRLHILGTPVVTSARRWQKEGRIYTTLRNWIIRLLYALGVSPARLARFYKNHRPGRQ